MVNYREYEISKKEMENSINRLSNIYRAIAENICKYCFKGQKLATSTYDNQNGGKTKTTNVIIEREPQLFKAEILCDRLNAEQDYKENFKRK